MQNDKSHLFFDTEHERFVSDAFTDRRTDLRCRVASRRRRWCEHSLQLAHDDCRRVRSTIWKLTKQTL